MGLQAEWPKAKQNSETCIHTGLPRFCMVFYWFDAAWCSIGLMFHDLFTTVPLTDIVSLFIAVSNNTS